MTTYFPSAPTIVDSNRILYTASPFARSSLFHLQEIGELTALKPHTSSRSELSSFLFFVVVSGAGTLLYDGREYILNPGSAVFIDCRKPYSHSTEDNLWTLRWCHFYGPSMSSIYQKYVERGGRPAFSPASDTLKSMNSVWTKLMETAGSADYMRDMLINQHLSELLVSLMSESWHPEEQKQASKRASVLEVKEWIDKNYRESITLDQLAEQFYINKYYLSKSFKSQFGMTISAYLLSVRITHAKQLLRFTNKTMDEIGEETGIGAPDYFSAVFKSVEGIPPSQYRKQW